MLISYTRCQIYCSASSQRICSQLKSESASYKYWNWSNGSDALTQKIAFWVDAEDTNSLNPLPQVFQLVNLFRFWPDQERTVNHFHFQVIPFKYKFTENIFFFFVLFFCETSSLWIFFFFSLKLLSWCWCHAFIIYRSIYCSMILRANWCFLATDYVSY